MNASNLTLPRIPQDAVKRSHYQGCLLGGAVGDALGGAVEFLSLDQIHGRFGPQGIHDFAPIYGRAGAITDDTQMTLFTAEGMLRAFVRMTLRGIGPIFGSVTARAYLRWLKTQGIASPLLDTDSENGWLITNKELFHRRAPGNTCLSALKKMTSIDAPARNDSKGCGGVMRVAPVGMFTANWARSTRTDKAAEISTGQTFAIAAELAALTHGHPTGYLTAGVFAAVVALLLAGHALPDAVRLSLVELRRHPGHEETLGAVEKAIALAATGQSPTLAIRALGEGWVAEEALAIGIYCALTATDFESALILAVNHDGDSDSTGSITGNLLGAIMGVESIPQRWLDQLELRAVIAAVADDLGSVLDWCLDDNVDLSEEEFYWQRYPGG